MIGWRARLGFLLPPGNPTVEAEMTALAPAGVSLHFHRMDSGGGVPGALDNQDERTRAMIDSLDASARLLAMVKPDIIVVAHTATSYHLGRSREAELLARLTSATGTNVVSAFGSVVAGLERLAVSRLARYDYADLGVLSSHRVKRPSRAAARRPADGFPWRPAGGDRPGVCRLPNLLPCLASTSR
jgi:maleate cis-trans isomerase